MCKESLLLEHQQKRGCYLERDFYIVLPRTKWKMVVYLEICN
jgi:hypothetical protein